MALEYYALAERCITVLYIMSEGDQHKKIEPDHFFHQCKEWKVFEMTTAQFKRFKEEKIDVAQMAERGDVWQKTDH